jgi:hypothetical protein
VINPAPEPLKRVVTGKGKFGWYKALNEFEASKTARSSLWTEFFHHRKVAVGRGRVRSKCSGPEFHRKGLKPYLVGGDSPTATETQGDGSVGRTRRVRHQRIR